MNTTHTKMGEMSLLCLQHIYAPDTCKIDSRFTILFISFAVWKVSVDTEYYKTM